MIGRRMGLAGALVVIAIAPASGQTASDSVEAVSLLGRPLARPALPPLVRLRYQAKLDSALAALNRAPTDPDSLIWAGRRLAYLGRYREAIAMFTRGITLHPGDARFYRHRGHRYLTLRRLDDAIRDLERADRLTQDQPDQVEPDGLPNAQGVPTSTLQSNIRYHLGLAWYLKGDFARALPYYRRDVAAAVNPDMLVASTHWLYMTLRRLGRLREAERSLAPITPSLAVIENQAYHRLCLMYRGRLSANDVLPPEQRDDALEDATVAYGLANWHLYHGRPATAKAAFERIVSGPQWGAFGYLAAEAELARAARGR